jgi:hypothetical protein
MAAAATGVARLPVQVTDCFLLAHDDFMQRTGQGRHVTQSLLELDRVPDMLKVRTGLARLVQKHPRLVARLRRNWRTLLPYWEVPEPPARGLPLGVWRESGGPAALEGATEIAGVTELLERLRAVSLTEGGVEFKARLDVMALRDGSAAVVLSWSHLLIDGKGAELLFAEIGRLCDGEDAPIDGSEVAPAVISWKEKLKRTKAAVAHLEALAEIGAPSLSGPRPRAGQGHYWNLTLSREDSARMTQRAESMVGALFPMAFYVAATARAHDRVFRHRGHEPRGYVASVPVQTRKRGARGPLFHNHVAIFFFCAKREHLGSIETTAAAMKQQFADMTRARLDESFLAILDMMMRLPSWLFMRVVRWQFKGEIASFYHSHTGSFAPEMVEFTGAQVRNAYHLPCFAAPPGTGLFFCERGGRVNVTLAWREGALSTEERQFMMGQAMEDLLGEPRPDLLHGL